MLGSEKEDLWGEWSVPANCAEVLGPRSQPGLCDPMSWTSTKGQGAPQKETNFSSLAGTPFHPQPCPTMD